MIAVRVSGPIRLAVVGAPAYFAARRPPRTPEDLTSHECVQYRMGANDALVAWLFERNGRTHRIPVTGRLAVNHPDLALRAALDGVDIACIPEGTAAPFLRTGELTRVLEGSSPIVEGLFIYYHGRRQVPVALRAFIDMIRGPKAARVT